MFKNILNLFALLFFVIAFSSCGFYKYNQSDLAQIKDLREHDPEVYGDPKGPAKQLANKYTDTPESKTRAEAIRSKFFGDFKSAMMLTDGPSPDKEAPKKDEKKTELKKEEKKAEVKK